MSRLESDDELMVMVQADDSGAFSTLYVRYVSRALRVAQSVTHNTARAEDVVQEGFLSMWRSRGTYRPSAGAFPAWAMRIVRNHAIDAVRYDAAARRPKPGGDENSPEVSTEPDSPYESAAAHSDAESLRASLRRLPAAQSEVITLAFFGELSHSEIATELELPPGTVKGRMRLGLEKLRRQMGVSG